MSDQPHELDALAAALGRRAEQREQDERAPEWEAVARAELELDEAVARRRAAGDEDEAELERAAAYFQPFDEGETASLVDGLLAGRAGGSDGGSDGGSGEGEDEGGEVVPLREREREPSPKPRHDPGSSGFWWIPGGMLLVAAAAILVWWVWPPSDDVRGLGGDDGPTIASREPLPEYVLETDGGLEQLRGDETSGDGPESAQARHRYRRDTRFEWVLRPEVDDEGEIGVRGFAFVDGGRAGLPLELAELVEIADSGAVRIAGRIGQLDLELGRYTIVLAVGRPADLPTQAAEVREPAADEAWQVRRVDVLIED